MNTTTKYETGATSHAVNDLILFTDNTRKLAEYRDYLYKKAMGIISEANDWSFDKAECVKSVFYHNMIKEAQYAYRMEFPHISDHRHISNLNESQKNEFCDIYANDFNNWKKENGF